MKHEKQYHYKVILLTAPSMAYPQIEHAQEVLNLALEALNSHELPPGMRFADNVTAELEVTNDLEQARNQVKQKKTGLIIACGFAENAVRPLAELCRKHRLDFCHASEPLPEERSSIEEQIATLGEDPHVMPVRFLTPEEAAKKFPGHSVDIATLTDATDISPEVIGDRVGKMIGIIGLGVMQSHHSKSNRL